MNAAPARFDVLEVFSSYDGLLCPGCANHEVGSREHLEELLPGMTRAAKPRCEFLGPSAITVDDRDSLRRGVDQVLKRFGSHFARANHDHLFVVQRLKDALRKIAYSDAGNADSPLVNRRFGRNSFGNADCRLEHAVHHGPALSPLIAIS